MLRELRTVLCVAAPALTLCACQHIPARPLDLDSSYTEWALREIDVQPVRDYAERLITDSGGDAAFDVHDGVSLREAEAIALWFNPELRIARLEAERAGALADTGARWPDPELGAGTGRRWFDGDLASSWIRSASLSITLPLSGRIPAENRALDAEHALAIMAAAEAEWRTLVAVREAWVRWVEAVERMHLLEEHLRLVDGFAANAQELARAGELDSATARLFTIERARKSALAAEVAFEVERSRAEIVRLLGLLPEAPVALDPSVSPARGELPARDAKDAALTHPTVVRHQAAYDAAEARLRVELRKQYPDITLSPTFEEEPGDETSITLGFGLPIPVWNANRQGIVNALADREIARARAENGVQQVRAEIAAAESAFRGARGRRDRLMAEAVPEVDRQIAESQALLESGELDMASLFQAVTQAYDVKDDVLVAVTNEQSQRLYLEALTHPLVAIATEKGPNE